MMKFLKKLFGGCESECGCTSSHRKDLVAEHKDQLSGQSEKQIDKTLQQSFPASDPPTNY